MYNRGKVNSLSRFRNPSLNICLSVNLFYFQTSVYFVAQGIHKYQDSLCYRRCVGHAINIPSVSPISLTSDVGIGTLESACLTSSTTTQQK